MIRHKILPTIVLFLLVSGGLFALDYENEQGAGGEGFLSSLVQSVFSSSRINEELLNTTSLQGKTVIREETSHEFFSSILPLPTGLRAHHLSIEGSTIAISEVSQGRPLDVVESLLKTKKAGLAFNRINEGTFYLNQVPIETKTHNFLGIVMKDTLYGFQYKPFDHPKVLEIVDALKQSK